MDVLLLTAAAMGVFSFLVWLARSLEGAIHRVKYPLKGAHFKVHEIPVRPETWRNFCNLAAMRDTNTKRQLAEAVEYFVEQKVKG